MTESNDQAAERPTSTPGLPAVHPTSPPLTDLLDRYWEVGADFDAIEVRVEPPEKPLAILEQLGPSPFARGAFPVIGFLATTYDKVSRYALERSGKR